MKRCAGLLAGPVPASLIVAQRQCLAQHDRGQGMSITLRIDAIRPIAHRPFMGDQPTQSLADHLGMRPGQMCFAVAQKGEQGQSRAGRVADHARLSAAVLAIRGCDEKRAATNGRRDFDAWRAIQVLPRQRLRWSGSRRLAQARFCGLPDCERPAPRLRQGLRRPGSEQALPLNRYRLTGPA